MDPIRGQVVLRIRWTGYAHVTKSTGGVDVVQESKRTFTWFVTSVGYAHGRHAYKPQCADPFPT